MNNRPISSQTAQSTATSDAAPTTTNGADEEAVSDRIFTIPNVISFLRLLMVPVVAVLIFQGQYMWAVVVLALAGISDWVDGRIARAFNQTSKLGTFLDPSADRLFIAVTTIGLAANDLIPWWLVVAVFARDVVVGLCIPFMMRRGYPGFPVHDVGKAGTFALMYAFPLLLLAQIPYLKGTLVADGAWVVGWAAALWGVYLYWSAGLAYLNQFRMIMSGPGRRSRSTNTARP